LGFETKGNPEKIMLVWLTIKKLLKKAWTWLKHNWKAPAIVLYTIVLWLFLRRKGDAEKVLQIRSDSYKEQIDTINKAHQEEIQKRDEILEKYLEVVDTLEKNHSAEKEELDNKKKKEVKEIVKEYYNKPDELAKKISDKFGFEYTEE